MKHIKHKSAYARNRRIEWLIIIGLALFALILVLATLLIMFRGVR